MYLGRTGLKAGASEGERGGVARGPSRRELVTKSCPRHQLDSPKGYFWLVPTRENLKAAAPTGARPAKKKFQQKFTEGQVLSSAPTK